MARRSEKTLGWYVSDRKWRRFSADVRSAVLYRVPRTRVIGATAGAVADDIRDTFATAGETRIGQKIANEFLDEVELVSQQDRR